MTNQSIRLKCTTKLRKSVKRASKMLALGRNFPEPDKNVFLIFF